MIWDMVSEFDKVTKNLSNIYHDQLTYHIWEYHNTAIESRDQLYNTKDSIQFHQDFGNGWHCLSFPEKCLLEEKIAHVVLLRTNQHTVSWIGFYSHVHDNICRILLHNLLKNVKILLISKKLWKKANFNIFWTSHQENLLVARSHRMAVIDERVQEIRCRY